LFSKLIVFHQVDVAVPALVTFTGQFSTNSEARVKTGDVLVKTAFRFLQELSLAFRLIITDRPWLALIVSGDRVSGHGRVPCSSTSSCSWKRTEHDQRRSKGWPPSGGDLGRRNHQSGCHRWRQEEVYSFGKFNVEVNELLKNILHL